MSSNYIYHYVYRITNLVEKKHYYGKRSSKIDPKLDLGKKYFSSSTDKEFKADQKKNPQNYRYKIIFQYESAQFAIIREIKLHNRFNVGVNSSFYNKVKQTSMWFDTTGISPSTKNKIRTSKLHKGVPKSLESNLKRSKTLTGRSLSIEHKEKLKQHKTKEHAENSAKARRKFLYITPIGTFDYARALETLGITKPTLTNWCRNNKVKITKYNYAQAPWLQSNYKLEEIISKTFEDLGFAFRKKPSDFLASNLF